MTLPLRLSFIIFCLGLLINGAGQQAEINFTSITSKDGLSSNSVNTILKDKYGLIWFGTQDGLNKFDGINITVYRHTPGDNESLAANEILSLHEDKKGNLWIGSSGGSLSLYDRQKDAFINFPSNNSPNTIRNNVILSVCSDHTGNIWIAHYEGINILDPITKRVTEIESVAGTRVPLLNVAVNCVFEDSRNRMWIGTADGLYKYNFKTKSFAYYAYGNDTFNLSHSNVLAIAEDKKGNVWIGTSNGLNVISAGTSDVVKYALYNLKFRNQIVINSIAIDGNQLWLGTNDGLHIVNTVSGELTRKIPDYRNIHSLTAQAVKCVFIDDQRIYWLGTIGGGINKYDKNLNLFNYVQSNVFDEQGLKSPIVTSFAEKNEKNVFVGIQGYGLDMFNTDTKLFRHFPLTSIKNKLNDYLTVIALQMSSKRKLLIGTFAEGLYVFDPVSEKYEQFVKGSTATDLNSNDIFCFKEDSKGNIWIGTNGNGLNVMNSTYKVVKRYCPKPITTGDVMLPINGYIRSIEEDKNGNIWIATHGGGIAKLQPSTGKFTIYNTRNSQLLNDKVLSLLYDSHGNLWAGTFGGGLSLLHNQQFITFTEKDGLQNSVVYKIVEDKQGLIWLSTNKGISSLDPITKKINNYNYHNGVLNNNFVFGSGLSLSTGELFFGGLDGFNYFNPAFFKKNNRKPPVIFTDLKINNQSVTAYKNGPINENIALANQINLDYKQSFALSFVGLNYTAPEQNQYAYKLEGFDKTWNYVGNTSTASYTNLDPGEYVFLVKASNNDGVWNMENTSIKILVRPPFWRTWYAYIFYCLVFIGSILFMRRRGIEKLQKQFSVEQEKVTARQKEKEAERIHELDLLKIRFLTNLSHEFRTPISLIIAPLEKLVSLEKNKQALGQLHMMQRNARRLLNLVNQLLDFRKMEEHELKLHATEGELVLFIKEICDSFKDLSERKKINFAFNSSITQLYTSFDHEKIERILFNVLSNAFKFTLEGGQINVGLNAMANTTSQKETWVSLTVSDTGIGIPNDKKEKIFERFFQAPTSAAILNQGTGIGLSITKEFVRMHGGNIEVESEPGKGATFIINFPFTPLAVPTNNTLQDLTDNLNEQSTELLNPQQPTTNEPSANTDIPTILLVEDNDDFRYYLKDNLRLYYKVYEATNGKEGWQAALSHHPQLIVSDISMPFMDGIELSQKIKADKRTSHIPVILLTALTGEEAQIKGLGTGANDYITKPFNFEVLNAKIKNLLLLNNALKSTYTKQIKVLTPDIEIESDNARLLNTIMLYLNENLTNSQLSVEELSRHVGMSRSSLYSKLLEITGKTPVEFIRSVKLEKAAVLLAKSDMNVAQIGYTVGFATPNYFAKSFKAKFNMLPSEYMNLKRKESGKEK